MTPLITASEGFPALEAATRAARRSIWMSFRIFDPTTRLYGPGADGDSWMDLLRAKLREGVALRIMLSDFDPIGATELHQMTWEAVWRLNELSDDGDLAILPIRHEARISHALRLGMWPAAGLDLDKQRKELNAMDPDARWRAFRARPGVWRFLRQRRKGSIVWRTLRLPRFHPATLHQKIAVFDAERVIIGGLDIDERRYDDKRHQRPGRLTWHDVSMDVKGPVAADAARHIAETWNVNRRRLAAVRREQERRAASDAPPMPATASALEAPERDETGADPGVRLIRTVSRNMRRRFLRVSPRTVIKEIEDEHLDVFKRAERLIYLETQFFRSRPLAEGLAEAGRRNPELGMIMVLPSAPEEIAFENSAGISDRFAEKIQAECVEQVIESFGERALFIAPVRQTATDTNGRDGAHGAEIIYVHAKVAICDDSRALVTSANMNGRSMRWDMEAGLVWNEPDAVTGLRRALFRKWLEGAENPELYATDSAVAAWRRLAQANIASAPDQRRGFIAPYELKEAEDFGAPAPFLPEELV